MQVLIFDNKQKVAFFAAQLFKQLLQLKPAATLGLATGSTPIELYKELVKLYEKQEISFSKAASFNLDEYYDIDEGNRNSYRYFMNSMLFEKIDINLKNTYLPTCNQYQNPGQQGKHYEALIQECGGIDLQLLGIGANGHIGFNEPTSSLASRTRIKSLTPQTIQDNSRLFEKGESQPQLAMTMGIATILDAKYIVLLATGEAKARAVSDMVNGPLSANCPASALQMHPNTIVLLDEAAASQLDNKEYLQWVANQNESIVKKHGYFKDL